MTDSERTEAVTLSVKVSEHTRAELHEVAYQRRTTVSALLRQEIDELLDEADVDLDDQPPKAEP
jgi:predicted transcriptional regulator